MPRSLDERRILWAAGDTVENRPPLSRWHPENAAASKRFIEGDATGAPAVEENSGNPHP